MAKINVYFRGGRIDDDQRKMKWDYVSISNAPKTFSIEHFNFKLHYVNAIDGGLIYDCINEYIQFCYDCNGKGHTECPECEGSGKIECDKCDAKGWSETPEHKKTRVKKEMELAAKEDKRVEMMKKQFSFDLERNIL